jgi:transposase
MFHNVGMSTRKFCLTQQEANALQSAYLHAQEADTKIRYQAVRLYGTGYRVAQICDICGCSSRSLLKWARAFQLRGITALVDHRLGGNCAKLKPEQIEAIHNQLHRYTPAQLLGKDHCIGGGQFWNIGDLALLLKRDYQVTYQSKTSLRTLLAKGELSLQRPAKVYKSHNQDKVMAFEEALEKK